MKITPEDYEILKKAIKDVVDNTPDPENLFDETMSETGFAWSLFWATGLCIGDGQGCQGDINLYAYLNDNHITTALKRIVKELFQA